MEDRTSHNTEITKKLVVTTMTLHNFFVCKKAFILKKQEKENGLHAYKAIVKRARPSRVYIGTHINGTV